jgi:O-antigen/teichoic acid export membrane protein
MKKIVGKIEEIIFKWVEKLGKKVGLDLPYFIKNGFWVMIRQATGMISGLVLSIIFARLATQEVFGQYQFVLSILSIASIVSVSGLSMSIMRSVARNYDGDYKRAIKIRFLWSLLGIPIIFGIGVYHYLHQGHSLGMVLMIASVFFPFLYAPNTWDSFFLGKSRFDIAAKYGAIQTVINRGAVIGSIFFGNGNLTLIMIMYLVTFAVSNGYFFWRSLRYIENNKTDKEAIKYGWFLTRINAIGTVIDYIDRIVLGIFNMKVLAVYSVALNLISVIKGIVKALFSTTFTKLSKSNRKPSRKNWFVIWVLALILSALTYLLAKNVIILLYTEQYSEAIPLLKKSAFLVGFFIVNNLFGSRTFSGGHKKKIYAVNVFSPLLTVVISFTVLFVTHDLFLFVIVKLYTRQILSLLFFLSLKDSQ